MDMKVLLMFSILLPASYGYMGGAPAGACSAMSPNHGGSAQTSSPSYTITTSPNTYDCGDTVTVTLGGGTLKGYLCQARPDVNTYSTVGSLSDGSGTTTNNCDGEAAITHTENSDKTSFQFTWTHSGTSTNAITFVCTIVQSQLMYWEMVTSSAITFSGTTACSGTSHVISSMMVLCVCVILNIVKGLAQ